MSKHLVVPRHQWLAARPEELAAGTMRYNYAERPARMAELPELSTRWPG